MEAHDKVSLSVDLDDETITFPSIDIKDKDYFFLPFNVQIGTAVLKSATVTPLCILKNETETYIFYGDKAPSYDIEGDLGDTKLITLSRENARNAWKVKCGKEHLIISKSTILQTEQGLEVIGRGALQMKVYPDFDKSLKGWVRGENEGEFTVYRKIMEQVAVSTSFSKTDKKTMTYDIELKLPDNQIEDCFLIIAYQGDQAKLYLEGELVADHFYTGRDWEIGLKRFGFPGKFQLEIDPLSQNDEVYLQEWPEMVDGIACKLSKISTEVEYKDIVFF
jgi:hypothetical protein